MKSEWRKGLPAHARDVLESAAADECGEEDFGRMNERLLAAVAIGAGAAGMGAAAAMGGSIPAGSAVGKGLGAIAFKWLGAIVVGAAAISAAVWVQQEAANGTGPMDEVQSVSDANDNASRRLGEARGDPRGKESADNEVAVSAAPREGAEHGAVEASAAISHASEHGAAGHGVAEYRASDRVAVEQTERAVGRRSERGAAEPAYPEASFSDDSVPTATASSDSERDGGDRETSGAESVENSGSTDPGGRPSGRGGRLTEELRLLAALRHAAVSSPSDALVLVAEHTRSFGNESDFASEREFYRVQALVAAGRLDEARDAARSFHALFPSSPYRGRITQLTTH